MCGIWKKGVVWGLGRTGLQVIWGVYVCTAWKLACMLYNTLQMVWGNRNLNYFFGTLRMEI